jgi:hypothetical protein
MIGRNPQPTSSASIAARASASRCQPRAKRAVRWRSLWSLGHPPSLPPLRQWSSHTTTATARLPLSGSSRLKAHVVAGPCCRLQIEKQQRRQTHAESGHGPQGGCFAPRRYHGRYGNRTSSGRVVVRAALRCFELLTWGNARIVHSERDIFPTEEPVVVAGDLATVERSGLDREGGADSSTTVASRCDLPDGLAPVRVDGSRRRVRSLRGEVDLVAGYADGALDGIPASPGAVRRWSI